MRRGGRACATVPRMMLTSFLSLWIACDGGSDASPETPSAPAAPAAAAPTAAAPTATAAAPTAAATTAGGGAVYAGRFASDPLLTPQQVALIPPAELRLVRNEVYARHGRSFQSADLQAHFQGTGWYRARADYSDALLTSNDRANATLIQSFEGEDGKKKMLSQGEYMGDGGVGVVFVDASTAEVMDGSGDLYNWTRENRHWTALGEWAVTWEGGAPTWSPTNSELRNVELWKLDHGSGAVLQVWPLAPQQG